MRIVVYDIAAVKGGGGETILNQYFDRASEQREDEWWFIVSLPDFKEKARGNVHVICADADRPSKLKCYIARKKFEILELGRIMRDINPDELISLQNMPVPGVKCRQTVYLHQAFQFCPMKYHLLKKEERSLAFRQKVICPIIKRRLRGADRVIVQTNWMKKAVSEWARYPEERMIVETPAVSLPSGQAGGELSNNTFIYPANDYLYKNHRIIIEACKILKQEGYRDYRILFTLPRDKSGLSAELLREIQEEALPIDYIGHFGREELFSKYRSLITLFPSCCETIGLPLLEAKSVGGRIIASDRPFSHEILDGYHSAEFVDWKDARGWATAMAGYLDQQERSVRAGKAAPAMAVQPLLHGD